jgi:hypothetical protein
VRAPSRARVKRPVARVQRELPPAAAALIAHGAPLVGRGASNASLEEAVAMGVRAARRSPALLRALLIVLAKHPQVRLDAVRARLAKRELPALGAVVDLAGAAAHASPLQSFAQRLFTELGPPKNTQAFFESPEHAQLAHALANRTPAPLRRWGFLCATPMDDFEQAVTKLARV